MARTKLRPARLLLCLTIAIVVGVTAVPAAGAAPATPVFGPQIDNYAANVSQSTCDPTAKPGVVDFQNLLTATYGRPSMGITRPCDDGPTSEHKEGRALDYPFDVNNTAQRNQANEVINWLLATDNHGNAHALLRRLGIMYIIWDRRIWTTGSKTWRSYTGPSPHTDHIHFSFGWPGALRQTSWWRQTDLSEGDVTGDGFADLTTVTADGRLAVYGNGILLPANEGRPFQNRMWQTDNTNWGTDAKSITTADVTGDGFADFLVLTTTGKLQIYGNGMLVNADHAPFKGLFTEYTTGWDKATHIAAGDINRDGWADLAATIDGKLWIFLNTRETGPNAKPFRDVTWTYDNWGTDVLDIAIGDVTGDAYADLAAIRTDGTLTVYGNGLLLPSYQQRPFQGPAWSVGSGWNQVHDITLSDVSGDGYADLTTVTKAGELHVYGNSILLPPKKDYYTNATWIYPDWRDVHHVA